MSTLFLYLKVKARDRTFKEDEEEFETKEYIQKFPRSQTLREGPEILKDDGGVPACFSNGPMNPLIIGSTYSTCIVTPVEGLQVGNRPAALGSIWLMLTQSFKTAPSTEQKSSCQFGSRCQFTRHCWRQWTYQVVRDIFGGGFGVVD